MRSVALFDPADSVEYSLRGRPLAERLCRFEIERSGHAMLERFWVWQRLVRDQVVLAALDARPWGTRLQQAFALPAEPACRVAL